MFDLLVNAIHQQLKVKNRDLDNGTNSMYCIFLQVNLMGKYFSELKFIILVSTYDSVVLSN